MSPLITQSSTAKLKQTGQWKKFLGLTISISTWTVTGPDGTPSTDLVVYETAASGIDVAWRVSSAGTVVLSTDEAPVFYEVTNHVVMSDGQEDDFTFTYEIRSPTGPEA